MVPNATTNQEAKNQEVNQEMKGKGQRMNERVEQAGGKGVTRGGRKAVGGSVIKEGTYLSLPRGPSVPT